ncbi:uncharacterized protein SCODWIG_02533 [Saccharomycodes ludwigii]|uniref:Beige protein homolog 1 n=1 Tax=Saccharomycodes ludwigii TaxID=36035 RepID=A0A376B7Y2_9ASCO|nr:uncharacterized protein SCODWIG_02533 [Saccharomycodes ludwigii]
MKAYTFIETPIIDDNDKIIRNLCNNFFKFYVNPTLASTTNQIISHLVLNNVTGNELEESIVNSFSNIGPVEENFQTTNKNGEKEKECISNSITKLKNNRVIWNICLILVQSSFLNKQILSFKYHSLKSSLFNLLFVPEIALPDKDITILKNLYIELLSSYCEPKNLITLYEHYNTTGNPLTIDILNAVTSAASISSSSFLDFEKYTFPIMRATKKLKSFTLNICLEFNSTTSNRFFCFGNKLFLELRDSIIYLTNNDEVISDFSDFDIELGKKYNITIISNLELGYIRFFYEGDFIQEISSPIVVNDPITFEFKLGSELSSFKCYRCDIWDICLNDAFIKIISKLSLSNYIDFTHLQHSSFIFEEFNTDMTNFKDTIMNSNIVSFHPMGIFRDTKEIKLDYNSFTVDRVTDSCFGKLYFNDTSAMLKSLCAINFAGSIFGYLKKQEDPRVFTQMLLHLTNLLESPILYNIFIEHNGQILLNGILLEHGVSHSTLDSIAIFNNFLRFCGWNSETDVIITHKSFYEHIILDMSLWIDAETELTRFYFYHLNELLTSKYSSYNYNLLKETRLLEYLLHYIADINNVQNYEAIIEQLFINLVKLDNKNYKTIKSLVQYCYYMIKFEQENTQKTTTIIISSIDILFSEAIDSIDGKLLRMVEKSLNLKMLFMLLNRAVLKDSNNIGKLPLAIMSILLKYLQISERGSLNFKNGDGRIILLNILKNFNKDYVSELAKLIFSYAFRKNCDVSNLPSGFGKCTFSGEFNELQHLLLELFLWILHKYNSECIDLFNDYVLAILEQYGKSREYRIFLESNDIFLPVYLVQIIIKIDGEERLSEQNTKCIDNVKLLLSNIFLNNCSLMTENAFKTFFKTIIDYKENIHLQRHDSYLKAAIMYYVFPSIVDRLVQFQHTIPALYMENPAIIFNVSILLGYFVETLPVFQWPLCLYMKSLRLVFICLEMLKNKYGDLYRKKKETIELAQYCSAFFTCILYVGYPFSNNITEFNSFFQDLLYYQELLFGGKEPLLESCIIVFILCFIIVSTKGMDKNNETMYVCLFSCFRTILVHRAECVPHLLKLFEQNGERLPETLFTSSYHMNDAEMNTLFQQYNHVFTEYYRNVFRRNYFQNTFLSVLRSSSLNPPEFLQKSLKNTQDSVFVLFNNNANAIYELFIKDSIPMDKFLLSNEHKRQLNFVDDLHDDEVYKKNLLEDILFNLEILKKYNNGGTLKNNLVSWGVDNLSTINKMRPKLKPSPKRLIFPNDKWSTLNLTISPQKSPVSVLSAPFIFKKHCDEKRGSDISFEIIQDINAMDLTQEENNNQNRKILKMLLPNENIKFIWNICSVSGLNISEGIFLLCDTNCYFISNYYFDEYERKVIELSETRDSERDYNIQLITGDSICQDVEERHDVLMFPSNTVSYVVKRPFLLRDLALEIILESKFSHFFTFGSTRLRDKFYNKLSKIQNSDLIIDPLYKEVLHRINKRNSLLNAKNGVTIGSYSFKVTKLVQTFIESGDLSFITQSWQRGQISNFYYLMIVNFLAGRSFNDLTQYPVFPWIVKDYESEELDLNDPKVYRDLSKPMGIQSESRKEQFLERYEALKSLHDENTPPFHYGTHYSSAMIVASYLIRLEPFTDSYLLLQGGKFGPPDRLFNSIERAWKQASSENTTDVRELIPEFFYLPEFLLNSNNYEFGKLHDGHVVDNVILPPWAKGDPKIFISKNREALESPYVSKHLHNWIDLIFGYKQRGEQAVRAVNVFNHLSYPGAINIDKVDNVMEKRSITGIIHNFGQTPLQLFDEPHPEKFSTGIFSVDYCWHYLPETPIVSKQIHVHGLSVSGVKYIEYEKSGNDIYWVGFPFLAYRLNATLLLKLETPYQLRINDNIYTVTDYASGELTAFCKLDSNSFVLGDSMGNLSIWEFVVNKINKYELMRKGQIFGHFSEIKEIKVSDEFQIIVTLDSDGFVFVWNLSDRKYIRCLGGNVKNFSISNTTGNIYILYRDKTDIFNLNGELYLSVPIPPSTHYTSVNFMNFYGWGLDQLHCYWNINDIILLGTSDGQIEIYELMVDPAKGWRLKLMKTLCIQDKSIEITSVRGEVRIIPTSNVEDVVKADVVKVEVVAGDSNSYLHVWK